MAAGGNGDSSEEKTAGKLEISPGSEVWCKTVFNEEFQGIVTGYDQIYRIIFIKTPSTEPGGKKNNYNVSMVNLNHVADSNFRLLALPELGSQKVPEYDLEKINKRYKNAVGEKKRAAEKVGVDVTNEAQELFNSINKYYPECYWSGKLIIVMDDVQISPPYKPENCSGQKSLDQIRKMVEKFHNDKLKERKPVM